MKITEKIETVRPVEIFDGISETLQEIEYVSKDCTFYASQADIENLIAGLDSFLKLPKSKFSKRFKAIELLRKQLYNSQK